MLQQEQSATRHEDQEGFLRDERLLIRQLSQSKCLQQVTIELPAGKELIHLGRPTEMRPRCLVSDRVCELPFSLNRSSKQQQQAKPQGTSRVTSRLSVRSALSSQRRPPSVVQIAREPPASIKRVYNGRGKTLYDFFESSESFECVFCKPTDIRPLPEKIYDYTANTRVIQLSNDYDPKLYCPLATSTLMPPATELDFDSNFQSGNLNRVFRSRTSPSEYFLLLQNDTNTHGYNHWFFFRVKNAKKQTYTFHVINMTKKLSMYRQGMKVSVFSEMLDQKVGRGWFKGGQQITYSNTRIERTTKQNETYYALAWNYTFQQEQDTVYFSLNPPYTYTRLSQFIENIEPVFRSNNISVTRKNIGFTLANNIIHSLVITDENVVKPKRVLLVMARQHPGETVGSFVAEGLIESLSKSTPESLFLLKSFRLVIIPMVNPDGVIYGHSRCNLAGLDLNRQWGLESVRELTPETFSIRRYILNLHEEYGIDTMIDLHGHSKKMNSFFYACKKDNRCVMRLLSYAMGKLDDNFDMYSCTYGLAKDKVNTVRSQLFGMGINAYTLENSYYGRDKNSIKEHYSESDLKNLGGSLLKALFVLYADKQALLNYKMNRQMLLDEIQNSLERFELQQNKNRNDSGSESDPDGDLLALEERVRTIKVRDPSKKSKLIKSFTGILKKKRYVSSIYKKRIEEREEISRQTLKQKTKDKEQLKHNNTEPTIVAEPPKKASRTAIILAKKFQRASHTQTESFKFSVSKEKSNRNQFETPTKNQQAVIKKQLSSKHSIPSRLLYEHPSRKKSMREPLRLTRTQQSVSHDMIQSTDYSTKRNDCTSRKFMTEVDAIKLKLNKEQLFKSCQFINKEKQLDETQFIKIESFYRNSRKQREVFLPSPPPTLTRKISRSKKSFRGSPAEKPQSFPRNKFRKFQNFLSDLEVYSNAKNRGLGGMSLCDNNSVLYHFPML